MNIPLDSEKPPISGSPPTPLATLLKFSFADSLSFSWSLNVGVSQGFLLVPLHFSLLPRAYILRIHL